MAAGSFPKDAPSDLANQEYKELRSCPGWLITSLKLLPGELAGWLLVLLWLSPVSVQLAVGQSSVDLSVRLTSDEASRPAEAQAAEPTETVEAEATVAADDSSPAVDASAADTAVTESNDANQVPKEAAAKEAEEGRQAAGIDSEHRLSVEPHRTMLPKDRPGWLVAEPNLEAPIHQFVVQSIPTSILAEVDANLDASLVESLRNYACTLLRDERAGERLQDRLTATFARINLVDEAKSYTAELQTAAGPMHQKWVMVEFTPEQRRQLSLWHGQALQRERLLPLGLGLVGLLTVVATSYLMLQRRGRKSAVPLAQLAQPLETGQRSSCRGSTAGKLLLITAALLGLWTIGSYRTSSHAKVDRPAVVDPHHRAAEVAAAAKQKVAAKRERTKQKIKGAVQPGPDLPRELPEGGELIESIGVKPPSPPSLPRSPSASR